MNLAIQVCAKLFDDIGEEDIQKLSPDMLLSIVDSSKFEVTSGIFLKLIVAYFRSRPYLVRRNDKVFKLLTVAN